MFLFLSVWLSSVVQEGNYPNDIGRVDSGYPFFVMCRKKRHGRYRISFESVDLRNFFCIISRRVQIHLSQKVSHQVSEHL